MDEFLELGKITKIDWESELVFQSVKGRLSDCRRELEKSSLVLEALNKNDAPFGIGLDFDDVRAWLLLDEGRWVGAHWERGVFNKYAKFATPCLSDACNFFAVDNGHMSELFDLLYAQVGQPLYVYADCYGLDKIKSEITLDVKKAFEILAQRFEENDLGVMELTDVGFECDRVGLYSWDKVFYLEDLDRRNRCWFTELGLAVKCMILIMSGQAVFPADVDSLFLN